MLERSKIDISNNNIALLSGNFGAGLGDLGLDILGLKEAGIANLPDGLLQRDKLPHVDFERCVFLRLRLRL
jgi:hypothetical protein